MNNYIPVFISIFSLSVAAYSLWIARDTRNRALKFINADYDLVIEMAAQNDSDARNENLYFVNFIISNRGKNPTSIRSVELIYNKNISGRIRPISLKILASPKLKSISNNLLVAKLSPGEIIVFSTGKDLFDGISMINSQPHDFSFDLKIAHSQKKTPDIFKMSGLSREISHFSTRHVPKT